MTSSPCANNAAFTSGSASTLAVSALIRVTTAGGVPAGASKPNHDSISKPGSAASATVGTSGNMSERFGVETASARTLPLLICGCTPVTVTNSTETSPASNADSAGVVPL